MCNYTLCASLMFVDDALVVKIFLWKNGEYFILIKGVWVDDWLGYICNLKPTQQSFFFQEYGSSTLLHSSWSNGKDADMSAEKKLSEGDAIVVGKSFKVGGCRSTSKEFHTIPEWELKLKHLPLMVLKIMSYINQYIAKVFGWAPMGADLSPTIIYVCSLR